MLNVFNLVLPFFGLIFLGFFVARINRQPLEALGWMNTFIVYVALPALFFQILSQTPVAELTQWAFIIGCTASTFCIFLTMFLVAYVRTRKIDESTIQGLAAAYGNIGYMGPALAILAFGAPAAVPVALIFCFDNTLHFVMAPLMMALSGNDKRSAPDLVISVLRKIFFHPFIIATILGVAAAIIGFEPPVALDRLIDLLAKAAAPCALFAMGATLALRPLKRVPKELYLIVPLKLLVQPVLIYGILSLAGDFPPIWVNTAMLMAALPTATNVFVIAHQYGVWVERASSSVLATTLFSVLTLTLWLYVMTHGLIE
ncbi:MULTISPECIES: AEC family transporter [Phyllobacterium]|jgi:malonate transporter|uniref:Malonate transporter n=1 Tax=Phyllobacterium sophorae TaxID=1520277 RepID=A0A2P7BIX2_9HYPH|nr:MULTISPECIES: AEC family transporter [Phyllobacterium]PSH66420.1 malonate transporter [Phyllobacterium sophorae]UXN64037.1 AEC family transporter [Phyllobacterium sp. A18/5-2]